MGEIFCKKCGGVEAVKNGVVRGLQRYRCRTCGCNFTATPPRGKPPAMKALALLLYAMGNMSFCSIARILKVSDVTIMRWVKKKASALPEPEISSETVVLMLDEMWHFLKKKQKSSGFGEPMTLSHGELLPGFWVTVAMHHAKNSSTKSD